MFSKEIVGSDAFLDMPTSSQLLYFHLGMEADDDGFIGNPKRISRIIGSPDDDLRILISKKFILLFESGVVVVKHHRINNNWDKYNCKRTVYLEEFNRLNIKENKAYTLDKSQGNSVQTENRLKTVFRIEENRIEENRINTSATKVAPRPKKEKKKDENEPMLLPEFVEWCRKSPQRHVNIIGEYADEKKLDFKTKGQWTSFIRRNLRPAKELAPYSDEQMSKAMKRLEADTPENNKKGFITKWTLETLIKYLDK